jgi:hypothetical protein
MKCLGSKVIGGEAKQQPDKGGDGEIHRMKLAVEPIS